MVLSQDEETIPLSKIMSEPDPAFSRLPNFPNYLNVQTVSNSQGSWKVEAQKVKEAATVENI